QRVGAPPWRRTPRGFRGGRAELPATIVAVAAFDADLNGQTVVTPIEVVALPAGQAAAHVVALQADEAVQLGLQAAAFASAQRAVAQADIDAAVQLVFAVADRLPAAAVLLIAVMTVVPVVVLGGGRNRDGRRGDGQHGDEGFLHHRSCPSRSTLAGLAALTGRGPFSP